WQAAENRHPWRSSFKYLGPGIVQRLVRSFRAGNSGPTPLLEESAGSRLPLMYSYRPKTQARTNMSTIVLAHGLFGFGDLLPGILSSLPSVHYFNMVADHFRDLGHNVLEPQVDPIGSIPNRGTQLAEKILRQTNPTDKVHIFAHSMGGLDSRFAISNRDDVAERIATLVTIGTPHRGSPVADAVIRQSGPIFDQIP